jgi:hypothetical protein
MLSRFWRWPHASKDSRHYIDDTDVQDAFLASGLVPGWNMKIKCRPYFIQCHMVKRWKHSLFRYIYWFRWSMQQKREKKSVPPLRINCLSMKWNWHAIIENRSSIIPPVQLTVFVWVCIGYIGIIALSTSAARRTVSWLPPFHPSLFKWCSMMAIKWSPRVALSRGRWLHP